MVVKIALEWWCRKRGIEAVKADDFEEVRNYIITGKSPTRPIVSITNNPKILAALSAVPFGIHTLFVGADPRSSNLVVIVGLFSLVFYKVFLTRNHPRLAKIEELATVNPQTGKVYEPSIRAALCDGPYISGIDQCDRENPKIILDSIRQGILKKLNEGMEKIRESNKKT